MTDAEALAALARAFPGIKAEPKLRFSRGPARPCTRCGDREGDHVRSTVMEDSGGRPYHSWCKRIAIGLPA